MLADLVLEGTSNTEALKARRSVAAVSIDRANGQNTSTKPIFSLYERYLRRLGRLELPLRYESEGRSSSPAKRATEMPANRLNGKPVSRPEPIYCNRTANYYSSTLSIAFAV